MAYVDDSGQMLPQPPQPVHTDATNPMARAFALQRIGQLVRAGLLGGIPQHMADPTLVWRGLSATLGQNPAALHQFLAAGAPVPHGAIQITGPGLSGPAPQLVSEHGYAGPVQTQAPGLVSENGYQPTPLPFRSHPLITATPLPGGPSGGPQHVNLSAILSRLSPQQFQNNLYQGRH